MYAHRTSADNAAAQLLQSYFFQPASACVVVIGLGTLRSRFLLSVFPSAGNLRTQDFGGPYNLSLLNVQEAEVKSELFENCLDLQYSKYLPTTPP